MEIGLKNLFLIPSSKQILREKFLLLAERD